MKHKKLKLPKLFKTDFPQYSIWTVEYSKSQNLFNLGTLHGLAEHEMDSPVYKDWKLIGLFQTASAANDYYDKIRRLSKKS